MRFIFKIYIHRNTQKQGYIARKVFLWCAHLLYCSVLTLGGNVNTRQLSKPDIGSIFHIKNQWNILVIGNYYVNYQNYQNLMLLTGFNIVRRVYATAINFSCITTLLKLKYSHKHLARFNTKVKDPKNDYSFYQQNCKNQWSCTSLVHDKVQNWLQFEFYLQTQFCLQNRDLIKHSVLFTIHAAVYLRYKQLFIYKQRFIYNQSFLYRDVFENRDQVRPYPSKLKAVTMDIDIKLCTSAYLAH